MPQKYFDTTSVVVPVHNDEWCVVPMFGKIRKAMGVQGEEWEVIFVNDGSTDGTRSVLENLTNSEPDLKVVNLRRKFGLTQAIKAGVDLASGEYIVTIPGNLQNDPDDIPKLLGKLREGYDVCAGWRSTSAGRLHRVRPRKLLNWIISRISGVKLHDYECTLRAYRSSILQGMRLYGDLDRYIPIYAFWRGGRIVEVEVKQYPRSHGKQEKESPTKRSLKTILDLVLLKFMERYSDRPFYVFGGLGLVCFLGVIFALATMVVKKYYSGVSFIETPLPLVTALFFLTGVILMVLGVMAEFLTRIYHAGMGRQLYEIENQIGFGTRQD